MVMNYTSNELRFNLQINRYKTEIKFFADIFDYQYDDIIDDLRNRAALSNDFEPTNIGFLRKSNGELQTFQNFEQGLIEYLFHLNRVGTVARNVQVTPFEGDSQYIKNLINYFATIYPDVCAHTLLSIAAAESGHFRAAHKLRANNIWGGMSGGRIIRYNNIELGTLTFVRLMSRNYYGRGLVTLEQIGSVYDPIFVDGVRQANPHWLRLVRGVKPRYENHVRTITLNEIIGKEEI